MEVGTRRSLAAMLVLGTVSYSIGGMGVAGLGERGPTPHSHLRKVLEPRMANSALQDGMGEMSERTAEFMKGIELNPDMVSSLFGDSGHRVDSIDHSLGIPPEAVLREMTDAAGVHLLGGDRDRIVSILFGDGAGDGYISWPRPAFNDSNAVPTEQDDRIARYLLVRLRESIVIRECLVCFSTSIVQGVAAERKGNWVAFFCTKCAPHLSVRRISQVPVRWPALLTGNESIRLSMIPLYKRCHSCRRYATFAPVGIKARREIHCKMHKLEDEIDVVHRLRKCQHWEGCTSRPSFATKGSSKPKFCKEHRAEDHVDVIHHRRCKWRGGEKNRLRCSRAPLFGSKGRRHAVWCAEHRFKTSIFLAQSKCNAQSCSETAYFGNWTDGVCRHCKLHSDPCEVDVVSTPFQLESIRGRGGRHVVKRVMVIPPTASILHPPYSLDTPFMAPERGEMATGPCNHSMTTGSIEAEAYQLP